jgi:hypothetical protein
MFHLREPPRQHPLAGNALGEVVTPEFSRETLDQSDGIRTRGGTSPQLVVKTPIQVDLARVGDGFRAVHQLD